ncbi:MAG: GNAT family N-acetyltransferase [Chloroflexota bacterium]|nr:GNAT family N-acetyltransferase [Chloroflexota bacterium]
MTLRGERADLRAVEREDAPDLHRWLNDPRVMRFWGSPAHTISRAEVQRRIEGWLDREAALGRPACLVIETLEGEAIGHVVIGEERAEARSVELSIMIGELDRWGQGYGTDAMETLLDVCFDAWNLHRVWVRSEASNTRAHRLYRRCGFVDEATLRDAAFLDGRWEDVLVFGILSHQRPAANGANFSHEGSADCANPADPAPISEG